MERKQTSPFVWIGIGCGLVIVAGVAFVAFIMTVAVGAMRSSTPYRDALRRAQNDPRVISVLGSPIKPGLFVSGSVQTENREGNANLDIRLSGPKGKAMLHVVGTKTRGRWTYSEMIVTPEKGAEINLLNSVPQGSPNTNSPAS